MTYDERVDQFVAEQAEKFNSEMNSIAFSFECTDGVYRLRQWKFENLEAEFVKNIDFAGELSLFSAYLEENPDKRVKRKDFLRYLVRWLNGARTERKKRINPAVYFENLDKQPEDQPTDNATNKPTDSTGQAQQGSENLQTLPEPEAAQRIHELEILCERLTAERDAARREAEIWQQQANKIDARFDRLLQTASRTRDYATPIHLEILDADRSR